jgi:cell division protein FtsZ
MKGAGYAHMAIGHGAGKDKAQQAAEAVIKSPLLETSIAGAKRLLINIAMSEDILSSDVDTATKMITDQAADNVEFIFGTAFKEDMQDEMIITVIAAGFDDPVETPVGEKITEEEEDEIIKIDNPLIDELGLGEKSTSSSQDDDLEAIFKMLGN